MASVLTFDEMNRLGIERRSVPYRDWFNKINLPRYQIDSRVETAGKVEDAVMDWFYFLVLMYADAGYFNTAIAANVLEQALLEAIPEAQTSPYLRRWVQATAEEITDSTARNWDDPYYLSQDRAAVIAENQSQTVNNYNEFEAAKGRGFRHKIWHGMMDSRERETHIESERQTVPIDEDFFVGENSYFIVPAVPSDKGADPEEYINCRCWATFM